MIPSMGADELVRAYGTANRVTAFQPARLSSFSCSFSSDASHMPATALRPALTLSGLLLMGHKGSIVAATQSSPPCQLCPSQNCERTTSSPSQHRDGRAADCTTLQG